MTILRYTHVHAPMHMRLWSHIHACTCTYSLQEAKKNQKKKDAAARKRAKEQLRDVSCKRCRCTVTIDPTKKDKIVTSKSKRCRTNGHHFLDPTRLSLDKDGACDACNGLAGKLHLFACLWRNTCTLFVLQVARVRNVRALTARTHCVVVRAEDMTSHPIFVRVNPIVHIVCEIKQVDRMFTNRCGHHDATRITRTWRKKFPSRNWYRYT